jgi:branched-chain amino acid transport system ATP-binding protein
MVGHKKFAPAAFFPRHFCKLMVGNSILVVAHATATLGTRPVLRDVDICVRSGEIVALFGHNAAGKSTLLRCIAGVTPLQYGTISLGFAAWRPDAQFLVRAGLRYLPQNERLFPNLTVEENLRVFADAARMPRKGFVENYARLTERFPILEQARAVRAGRLSGGEAQQVALARTLLGRPKLLLLDEPSIGLAAPARTAAFAAIRQAANELDVGIILVEHRIQDALGVACRVYGLRRGSIGLCADAKDIFEKPELLKAIIL